jgi:hypothetical protein
VRWSALRKNAVMWRKNLTIRSSSKKSVNSEEVEGYEDPSRETA